MGRCSREWWGAQCPKRPHARRVPPLAAGAIVYVVARLLNTGRRLGAREIIMWDLLGGVVLSVVTELVIKAAGG